MNFILPSKKKTTTKNTTTTPSRFVLPSKSNVKKTSSSVSNNKTSNIRTIAPPKFDTGDARTMTGGEYKYDRMSPSTIYSVDTARDIPYSLKVKLRGENKDFEVDHIYPVWLGGTESESNLQALSQKVHGKKTWANDSLDNPNSVLSRYKRGELTPGQARVEILQWQKPKSTLEYFFDPKTVGESFKTVGKGIAVDAPKSIFNFFTNSTKKYAEIIGEQSIWTNKITGKETEFSKNFYKQNDEILKRKQTYLLQAKQSKYNQDTVGYKKWTDLANMTNPISPFNITPTLAKDNGELIAKSIEAGLDIASFGIGAKVYKSVEKQVAKNLLSKQGTKKVSQLTLDQISKANWTQIGRKVLDSVGVEGALYGAGFGLATVLEQPETSKTQKAFTLITSTGLGLLSEVGIRKLGPKIVDKVVKLSKQKGGLKNVTVNDVFKAKNEVIQTVPHSEPGIVTTESGQKIYTENKAVLENWVKNNEKVEYKITKELPEGVASRFEWNYKTKTGTIYAKDAATASNLSHELGHFFDRDLTDKLNAKLTDLIPDYISKKRKIDPIFSSYVVAKNGGKTNVREINKGVRLLVNNWDNEVDKLAIEGGELRAGSGERFASAFSYVVDNPSQARSIAPNLTDFIEYNLNKVGLRKQGKAIEYKGVYRESRVGAKSENVKLNNVYEGKSVVELMNKFKISGDEKATKLLSKGDESKYEAYILKKLKAQGYDAVELAAEKKIVNLETGKTHYTTQEALRKATYKAPVSKQIVVKEVAKQNEITKYLQNRGRKFRYSAVRRLDKEDIGFVEKFIDAVRSRKNSKDIDDVDLEDFVRTIAKKFGINPNVSNATLAKKLEFILDDKYGKAVMIANQADTLDEFLRYMDPATAKETEYLSKLYTEVVTGFKTKKVGSAKYRTETPKKKIKVEYESEEEYDMFGDRKIKNVTVPNYIYHTTSLKNIDSITKNGLIPKGESNFDGTAEAIFAWTSPSEIGPAELMRNEKFARIRINTDAIKSNKDIGVDTDFGGSIDDIAGNIWQVYQKIGPEYLEIKKGNKWVPLLETNNGKYRIKEDRDSVKDAINIIGSITRNDSDRYWLKMKDKEIINLKKNFGGNKGEPDVELYRGSKFKTGNGMSFWTRDRDVAKAYAGKGGKVESRTFKSEDIIYDSDKLRASHHWEQMNQSMRDEIESMVENGFSDRRIKKELDLTYFDRDNIDGSVDLNEVLVNVGNNGKYRPGSEFKKLGINVSDDQEKQIININKKIFGDEDVRITAQIFTPEGQKALGVYKNRMIKILDGQAKAVDTYYHEAVHKYLDTALTIEEQTSLLDFASKKYGLDDFAQVEERLAEDFINYAQTRKGVTGQMKVIFDKVLERVKKIFDNEDQIKSLYSDILSGKAKERPTTKIPQVKPQTVKAFSGEKIMTKAFNEKKLNTSDDVLKIINDVAENNNQFSGERRSTTLEEMKDFSRKYLGDEKLYKSVPAEIRSNIGRMKAAQQTVVDMASDLQSYLKTINPVVATDEELAIAQQKLFKLEAVSRAFAGARTEASHLFSSLRGEVMVGENDLMRDLVTNLQQRGINSQSIEGLIKIKKEALQPTLADKGFQIWYASILSGPKTSARNILGNTWHLGQEVGNKILYPKFWNEIPDTLRGLDKGFKIGLKEGKEVLTGKTASAGKFIDSGTSMKKRPIGGKFGDILDLVGRVLNAEDKVFYNTALEMERSSLEGLVKKGKLSLTPEQINEKAIKYAERIVYRNKPEGTIGAVASGITHATNKAPVLKLVVPFVRTVANVTDRQLDYIPFVNTMRVIRAFQKEGSREGNRALGRAMIGATAATLLYKNAKDKISGRGPSSYTEKQTLMQTGWRPNSIKVGDSWVPYTYFGPIASIFALVGNINDSIKYNNVSDKALAELYSKGLGNWSQSIMDQSFLSGVADLLDAAKGDTPWNEYFTNLITGLVPVPAIYTQTKDMTFGRDSYIAKSLGDKLKYKVGITEGLEPSLNVYGEQNKKDLIYGMTPTKEEYSVINDFIKENPDVKIAPPAKTMTIYDNQGQKRKLTPKEYTEFVLLTGPQIKEEILKGINSGKFRRGEPVDDVEKIIKEIRDDAKEELFGSQSRNKKRYDRIKD